MQALMDEKMWPRKRRWRWEVLVGIGTGQAGFVPSQAGMYLPTSPLSLVLILSPIHIERF